MPSQHPIKHSPQGNIFNENSRVKIPAILHLIRLGYQYLSLSQNVWDKSTNMSQILVFSNNMEYDRNDTVEPLQGAYYAASSYQEAKFNFFREEDDYAGFSFDNLNDGQILVVEYKGVQFRDTSDVKEKVYAIFDSKQSLIKDRIDGIDSEIKQLRTEIKNIEDICLKNIQELRAVYIEKIIEKLPAAASFLLNNKECDFLATKEDENFKHF